MRFEIENGQLFLGMTISNISILISQYSYLSLHFKANLSQSFIQIFAGGIIFVSFWMFCIDT